MPQPLDRRLFIQRLSFGSLAIAALGVTAFACSDDEPAPTGSTTAPSPTGSPASTPPTSSPATSTMAATTTTTESALPSTAWSRANLGFVSAYAVVRDGEAAIVDTGVDGSANAIELMLATLDAEWDDVAHVILTHLHGDHVGSLPAVMASAADATAYAHQADIPQIRSPRPITAVADADTVFGLTVIHTPGHTPGHIALHEPELRVLFAGDAINGANPGVAGPNAQFTPDMALAIESARRLGTFDYEIAVFGHGEPVVEGASAAVAAMAAGL